MPVFSYNKVNAIATQLGNLRNRMVVHHAPPALDVETIYKSLVRPEHLSALRQADEVCGVIQRHHNVKTKIERPDGEYVEVLIGFTDPLTRLLPAYVSNGFHEDADRDMRENIKAWVARRYSIGASFALAKAAFVEANKYLSSASQMRIYFPGVLALMSAATDEVLQAKAAKLSEAPVPTSLPSLAPELRQYLMDATKLIARAMLLSTEIPPTREINLSCYSLGHVVFPWRAESSVPID